MSQNLRLALWVPNVDPASIGNAIRTTDAPTVNKRIPSEFAAGGGGSGVVFADQGEVTAGLVPNEAISPLTLRNDNARMLDIPTIAFLGVVTIITSTGAASANKLVKSNANGLIDDTLLEMDGGTF
jgi:hypothetical protein